MARFLEEIESVIDVSGMPNAVRPDVVTLRADVAYGNRRFSEAAQQYRQAGLEWRQRGNARQALSIARLGASAEAEAGHIESAKATLQEISVLASDNGLVFEEAAAFEVLAHVHRLEGDRGGMTSCLQRAIDRYEEAGMKADAARLTAWLRDNR
jgi:tetratricopeptide (TPR) repeat protein